MLFKLNCSDCPCGNGGGGRGEGEDKFCNSVSKEYFVHLNRIVSLRGSWQNIKYKSNFPGVFVMQW